MEAAVIQDGGAAAVDSLANQDGAAAADRLAKQDGAAAADSLANQDGAAADSLANQVRRRLWCANAATRTPAWTATGRTIRVAAGRERRWFTCAPPCSRVNTINDDFPALGKGVLSVYNRSRFSF
jgi:hypothetical protein